MRLTVGPLPPAVYWRRRVIVLGGLLLALFLVLQACNASRAGSNGDRDDAAAPTHSPSPTPAATPTLLTPRTGAPPTPSREARKDRAEPSASRAADEDDDEPAAPEQSAAPADGTCADEQLRITAESEQTTFQRGQYMSFTIKIKNVSDRTCRADVGADVQELRLVANDGETRVWSSDDCGTATGNDVREFVPGFERAYFVTWNGRSSSDCAAGAADGPVPAHGKYQLVGRLGDTYSDPLVLTLT
jgi:hypothetical protein